MQAPLSARAAVLQSLGTPAYGLQILERVRRRTRGRVRMGLGSVYPALRQLERQGLVRSWQVPASGAGRPRRYYELTRKGIAAAAAEREALAGLLENDASGTAAPAPEAIRAMRWRLRECARVSAFVSELRRRTLEAGARRQ